MAEHHTQQGTRAVWMEESAPAFERLQEDLETAIAIVGAGYAGLTVAYLLAREGRQVAVVEKGGVACGQSARTTAHHANAFDDRYSEMIRLHGEENARLLAESHTEAIRLIEQISRDEGIDCDFARVPGYLFPGRAEDRDLIGEEYEAARRAGVAVEKVARVPLPDYDTGSALRFPDQGKSHPLKYLSGLARAAVKHGGKIYGGSRVVDIEEGKRIKITLENGRTVTADALVLATNSPSNRNLVVHGKQSPYRSYVVGIEVPQDTVPDALYWDTLDPYHYVRVDRGESLSPDLAGRDLLLVGGEDHGTGKANDMEERYRRLEEWARKLFPRAGAVRYRWSGQVMEPADGIAMIGKNPGSEHVYIITGDSGMGTTHGTLGGQLICDLIIGRENAWEKIYAPSRLSLKAAPEYALDQVEMASGYVEWLTGDDGAEEENIPTGEGLIVRQGVKKMAVYKDEQGRVHKLSAVCPHLGCIVAWNGGEKSWDCPCHGSRYQADGRFIEGPACKDLSSADAAKKSTEESEE